MLANVEGRRECFAIPQNLRSYLAINFSNDYYALSHELPIFCPQNAIYASTMAFFCEKIWSVQKKAVPLHAFSTMNPSSGEDINNIIDNETDIPTISTQTP